MVCNFLVVITSVWRILSRWFSREKSSGPAEEVQTAEDRHVTVYNSGEDSLAISPSSRGSRSTNTTNSDSATSSHRTNTTTMSGFSTLTDIATFSLRSMELGAVGSRSDPHSNGRQSGRSVMAG
ncbi:hypothetical protein E1B28_009694 [Marasmius oreades]|uniref:Uncharacterized protein n=1 Tax=Marasmius oreades TaxID=181124 RepID=A0A9P7USW2_9AGAR|nr:uncharacterized protein E1B28_009694 [Marasmius oreades]KAG7090589.1 hypothetical protein E1B28_009694 [Marasmius oreades]